MWTVSHGCKPKAHVWGGKIGDEAGNVGKT